MDLKKIFKNKKVIVTGHTGFKGSWLTCWLHILGAKVIGLSLNIPTKPSHFISSKINYCSKNKRIDIRNLKLLKKIFKKHQPDYVFHLAAQALVKKSYSDPINTWQTNLIGTLNVIESLREIRSNCVAVLITSDKSYKNLEINRGYKESDILGGRDPYSASKGSAELAIQSHISSFFPLKNTKVLIGIGRAGNVIGGGDWSDDRLIPDCIKSWAKNKKVIIRNPNSTRPWQHVLEAVSGYLYLAANLKKNKYLHGEAFNFGPKSVGSYKVIKLVKSIKKYWTKISWKIVVNKKFYEANLLRLDCKKAKKFLKWQSVLNFNETVSMVAKWYKNYYTNNKKVKEITRMQIQEYENLLKKRSIR